MPEGSSEFVDTLTEALHPWALARSQDQLDALRRHYQAVVEANRRFNLTRITEPADAAVKHYADSLSVARWADACGVNVMSLLDVGTGPGFPAVPLAIVRPHWRVTAIDSTRKKIDFLSCCAIDLGLANLDVHHAHASHWKTHRRFDVVAIRAVGPLSTCLDQTARFVAPRGHLVVFKTPALSQEERHAAQASETEHRLAAIEDFPYELQLRGETLHRLLCVFHRPR